ncbi:MAG: carboxypeptidase-like regulatory domain-containing protein, partial [Flavobacteriales bacterium]|nr:carboxypeptidase-like regulatory domain-containing protein [Flavobacteriales bacterium]
MKSLKLFFQAVIGSLSLGAAAQNYEVKGVVIDAKGNPVVGATVRTNKSKAAATTKAGGVYTLTATPKDTELRLIINKYTVMEKELSAAIASHPIAFELDETNDPAVTGYMMGDTYYLGTNDTDIERIF